MSLRGNVGLLALVIAASSPACQSTSELCHPTKAAAASEILSAWCERWVACGHASTTVATCVDDRAAIAQVPDETGCAACSDNESIDCERSICRGSRVSDCASASRTMACEAMVDGPLVMFPQDCDACFR